MAQPLSKAESSYTAAGLLNSQRPDGRSLLDYRPITLATGVAPTANGSARARIGDTDVVVAVKLDMQRMDEEDEEEGRCVCSVECSPSAFPHLDRDALSDLSTDLTDHLRTYLTPLLTSPQLLIIPHARRWQLAVDALVLAHSGNLHDTLFAAARSALWDLRLPRTRGVVYDAPGTGVGGDGSGTGSVERAGVLDHMRGMGRQAVDFELEDGADEGLPLEGRDDLPVCLTMNLLSPVYYLDATSVEEACSPTRLLLFVRPSGTLCGIQKLGSAELHPSELKQALQEGVKHAKEMAGTMNRRLREPTTRSLGSNLGPFS
ncbi:ribosomal protein S5 domain 2-like protein [Calocera viscosa TUFC12733]|uniref:Ribosomal RNA-processing protein 42 n=1 Tax=Calocera viscosa (strain TUFC12733) TaxID=1330018 RepID=A0A167P6R9_CALVF|nr:ribosomal protein S5 domain 2-like protein [Calocera viscosa TUFC12733]